MRRDRSTHRWIVAAVGIGLSLSLPVHAEENTEFVPLKTPEANVFLPDQEITLGIDLGGLPQDPRSPLVYEVSDFFGRKIEDGVVSLVSTGAGRKGQLSLRVRQPGWFRVTLGVRQGSEALTLSNHNLTATTRFLPFAILPASSAASSTRFGICEHYLDSRNARLIRLGGFTWLRTDVSWGNVQKEKGQFDWSRLDKIVKLAQASQIQLLLIVDYTAPWASTGPLSASAQDRRYYMPRKYPYLWFVKNLVSRYKPQVRYWEIWNEPNLRSWLSPKTDYAQLLQMSYTEVKRADPNAVVLMGGTSGAPVDWVQMLKQEGALASFDCYNIHPYHYQKPPEGTLSKNLSNFLKGAAEAARKPTWITEIGAPTNIVTLEQQASYLVRDAVLSLAAGVAKFFWYELADARLDPNDKEANFGILFSDLTPKPAYVAYAVLTRVLGQASYLRQLDLRSSSAYGFAFSTPKGAVSVVWTTKDQEPVQVPVGSQPMWVVDLMGGKRSLQPVNGVESLPLTPNPIYLCEGACL